MNKKHTNRRHSILVYCSIMYDIIYVVKYLVGLMFVILNTSTYTEVRYYITAFGHFKIYTSFLFAYTQ